MLSKMLSKFVNWEPLKVQKCNYERSQLWLRLVRLLDLSTFEFEIWLCSIPKSNHSLLAGIRLLSNLATSQTAMRIKLKVLCKHDSNPTIMLYGKSTWATIKYSRLKNSKLWPMAMIVNFVGIKTKIFYHHKPTVRNTKHARC